MPVSNELNLAGLEKRAWLRVFEDGVWDIEIGLLFVSLGATIATDWGALAPIAAAVLTPACLGLKLWITAPRIGHVRFAKRRVRRVEGVTWLLAGLALLTSVLVVVAGRAAGSATPFWVDWVRHHFAAVLGAMWGGTLALAGGILRVPRFCAYGLALLVALVVSDLTGAYSIGSALMIGGSPMALVGAVLLVLFVRRHPRRPSEEDADAGQ